MIERAAIERGAILYDPGRIEAPDWGLFDRERWRARGALTELPGGRGSIQFIDDGERRWALRHYLRGGWAARFSRDRYLYLGEERTRPFREFRLLARLRELGLPVPVPVAAGYRRGGLTYTAALLTERLPSAMPLPALMRAGLLDAARWRAIGACLRRFHDAGAQHADLNAHNILLDESGQVWLLDFDRGRLRAPGAWRERVLARLERSLAKLAGPDGAWREGFAQIRATHDA
jgi:3-deoxy-D-manno-octulosonic acid kinase